MQEFQRVKLEETKSKKFRGQSVIVVKSKKPKSGESSVTNQPAYSCASTLGLFLGGSLNLVLDKDTIEVENTPTVVKI